MFPGCTIHSCCPDGICWADPDLWLQPSSYSTGNSSAAFPITGSYSSPSPGQAAAPGLYIASILDENLGPTKPRGQCWLAGQQNNTQTPLGEERPAPGSHSSICRSKCRQCPQFSLSLSGRHLMPWLQIQVLKWRFCLGPTPPWCRTTTRSLPSTADPPHALSSPNMPVPAQIV